MFAEAVGFLHVVRDEQRGPAESSESFLELRFDLPAQVGIERGERLIEQQRFRLNRQGAGQGGALLFAAG